MGAQSSLTKVLLSRYETTTVSTGCYTTKRTVVAKQYSHLIMNLFFVKVFLKLQIAPVLFEQVVELISQPDTQQLNFGSLCALFFLSRTW